MTLLRQGFAGQTAEAAPDRRVFTPFAVLWMVLIGVFAFSALTVLGAYAPDLKTTSNGEAHALSKSAIGFAGLLEVLKGQGAPVVVSRTRLPAGRSEGLLVATPAFNADPHAVHALGFGGPVLVVLPKWEAEPNRDHPGWIGRAEPIDPQFQPATSLLSKEHIARRAGVSQPVLHAVDAPFGQGAAFRLGAVDRLQTFTGKDWVPILVDEAGATVLARDAKSEMYVLSDPDIMNTHGLKSLDTLVAAVSIIGALKNGDGPVIFDVTLNGLGKERSILRLLFDPPFLAVTLCLAAAAALAGFQAACRFGPLRRTARVFALGKEALADNSAALIRLARREHRMGGRYAALTRAMAARAVAAPRDLSGEALTEFLDRMGAQRGAHDQLSELTFQAETAQDRARLLVVAQRLFRWRLEMTRERQ